MTYFDVYKAGYPDRPIGTVATTSREDAEDMARHQWAPGGLGASDLIVRERKDWLVEYLENLIADARNGYAQEDDAQEFAKHIRRYMADNA